MQQPPEADRGGENHQSEDLVTPERVPLPLARLLLGDLLVIRLDAGFDHGAFLANSGAQQTSAHPASV